MSEVEAAGRSAEKDEAPAGAGTVGGRAASALANKPRRPASPGAEADRKQAKDQAK